MKKVTIANCNNISYFVKGKQPLLIELRLQGLDLPYGCQYGGVLAVRQN